MVTSTHTAPGSAQSNDPKLTCGALVLETLQIDITNHPALPPLRFLLPHKYRSSALRALKTLCFFNHITHSSNTSTWFKLTKYKSLQNSQICLYFSELGALREVGTAVLRSTAGSEPRPTHPSPSKEQKQPQIAPTTYFLRAPSPPVPSGRGAQPQMQPQSIQARPGRTSGSPYSSLPSLGTTRAKNTPSSSSSPTTAR